MQAALRYCIHDKKGALFHTDKLNSTGDEMRFHKVQNYVHHEGVWKSPTTSRPE